VAIMGRMILSITFAALTMALGAGPAFADLGAGAFREQ